MTQQEIYLQGYIEKCAEYGIDGIELIKMATFAPTESPGSMKNMDPLTAGPDLTKILATIGGAQAAKKYGLLDKLKALLKEEKAASVKRAFNLYEHNTKVKGKFQEAMKDPANKKKYSEFLKSETHQKNKSNLGYNRQSAFLRTLGNK